MTKLPNPPRLTADGAYNLPVIRGGEYLMTLSGHLAAANAYLEYLDASGNWRLVADAFWDGSAYGASDMTAEIRFRAPANEPGFRLTLEEGDVSTYLNVNLVQIS